MNNLNSLRNLYRLEYDHSGFKSSLIDWYNSVIDKSVDELSVLDVSKMVRQNILREVAIDRAIELFFIDPFDGEIKNGDLLALLVSCSAEVVNNKKAETLASRMANLENEISGFDWVDEDEKMQFIQNKISLETILRKNPL